MSKLKRFDNRLRKERGVEAIGGVDEVGRGCLAGPVVAGVVVLGPEARLPGVNDSKLLTREEREKWAPRILEQARAFALGMATAEEVDRVNILQATHLAVHRAIARLAAPPEFMITDHLTLKPEPCPQLSIPKADSTSLCVAAASVIAKVARDRMMALLDAEYPGYGLARHKGYATPEHWRAIREHGASTLHRLSFNGVVWFGAEPGERSRSFDTGELPDAAPLCDLHDFLRDDFAAMAPHGWLPEMEYRMRARKRGRAVAAAVGGTDREQEQEREREREREQEPSQADER